MDLVVAPGPGVPQGLTVPGDVLVERFSRSSGPGGQGVNTADSRVELELDVDAFAGVTETQRLRVLRALAPRRATRPTRGSKERRLSAKKRRGETKAGRSRPASDA